MQVVYSDRHRVHAGAFEFFRGEQVPCFEKPQRADFVLDAVRAAAISPIVAPREFPVARIERVHAPRYLRFLETAWAEWSALGNAQRDAFPSVWPIRGMRDDVEPADFVAKLGLYSFDNGTPFTAGTWEAAKLGADIALTAQAIVAGGERAAFALSRPPGHHAGADFNGTQAVFYERADVLFQSIHGDPRTEYPFYLGHADETGRGAGAGFNRNFPLPAGASNAQWFEALGRAADGLRAYRPGALVVSLGVDTYVGDPICSFSLDLPDYERLGAELAALGLPTVFVLEGGYAVAEIGRNVAAVLAAFEKSVA